MPVVGLINSIFEHRTPYSFQMKNNLLYSALGMCLLVNAFSAQTVTIQVDVNKNRNTISPYIYGRNNSVTDQPGTPITSATWKMMRAAGLRMTRENGGNNATKYNWRKKISSHPDWYNNVYNHDWDYAAKSLADSMPGVQGMWAFQLDGYAASNLNNNFNDWAYNQSNYWPGVCQNLAGGGVVNPNGSCTATTPGNINLYLETWTADSTTAILDHWFGTGGLGLNKNNIKYWSMDNEPDIWSGTHDDVFATQPTAENFMQLYFAVAKKARAKYPAIKLCGPVPASEWQWYAWNNVKISYNGGSYTWLEYFIKRCAEEQTASGVRLLDVIDIHSYPNDTVNANIVQLHRIYFDTVYAYPGANGVKTTAASGWDNNITNENVFGRCSKWLTQYMGPNNGVNFSVSEYGSTNTNANVTANSYASILGTFGQHNVEYFTPWYWYPGMWETLHLYSRYAKTTSVQGTSSNEQDVSAYPSVNASGDSMTVMLVNRSLSATHSTTVNLSHFTVANGTYSTLQLHSLPATETFVSHTSNALHAGTATVSSNSLTVSLPPLSTTAVILKGTTITGIADLVDNTLKATLYPNPTETSLVYVNLASEVSTDVKAELVDMLGQVVYSKVYSGKTGTALELRLENLPKGIYTVKLSTVDGKTWSSRLVKMQ
jgi:hypothetical protein